MVHPSNIELWFVSTVHTDEHVDRVLTCFADAVAETREELLGAGGEPRDEPRGQEGATMTQTRPDLSRRQFLVRAAGGAVLAMSLPELLAACTNAGQEGTGTASGSPGGPSTATLRVGWSSEPDTMNPLTSYSTEGAEVQQLIYDKLMDYDATLQAAAGARHVGRHLRGRHDQHVSPAHRGHVARRQAVSLPTTWFHVLDDRGPGGLASTRSGSAT